MRTLDDAILKNNDRDAIRAAAEILRHAFPVEKIILFGSKARGDDDLESDIDLLVLMREPVTHALKRQMTHAIFDLQLSYNVVFSMIIVPLNQWQQGICRILPIRHEIERDGIAA